jgi:hypothetical protein
MVRPGEPLPTERDLLTEASLPIEERALQRRYTTLQRFDLFVPPTGRVFLPGPDPVTLPKDTSGLHLILLRIEATNDREGNSERELARSILAVLQAFRYPSYAILSHRNNRACN